MLKIRGLCSGYGSIEVLHEVSLEIREGEVVTLLGANGAGKTTTLMTISGIVPIRRGEVLFNGISLDRFSAHEIVRLGLGHVPEGRKIFPRLSVIENLEMGAFVRSSKEREAIQKDRERIFDLFPVLKERLRQPGGTLSGGEQQMLAVGRALMGRPKLLLLDEPSLGLAPLYVAKIFQVLVELNRQGTTLLVVEQNAHTALQVAHRAYVMETGKITVEGKASDLMADSRVREAYLGG